MSLRPFGRVLVVALLGAMLLAPSSGGAHQASPESATENPFADLGLQQIDITVTDTAFEGVPATLDAGRYVVALTNTFNNNFGQGGAFLRMPPGVTMDQFMDLVAPGESSPVAGGDIAWPPDWYYESEIAGGPYAYNGETAYAVVELTEGEWVFWAEYPDVPQAPVPVTVTGEMPADAPLPDADITIEMSEFAFSFSSELTPGTHVIKVVNVGDQPHFLIVAQIPDGTTQEELLENFAVDAVDILGTGDQSAGATAWYVLTVEPGTFFAVCAVPDPGSNQPHALMGMLEVFDVDD